MTSSDDGRRARLDGLAVALLVTCCALWGVNQVAAKVALVDLPPLLQAGLRSAGAAVLVVIWARWRGLRLFERDGTLGAGLLAGSLFAIEFACIFIGLQYTGASRMVVFIYLAPFVVALLMPLVARHERLDAVQGLGLAIAFGGVVWAFAEGLQGGGSWLGDALGLLAAVLWAGTTVVVRATRLSRALPEKTLLYQLGVSAVILGSGSVMMGESWSPATVSALSWASLAFQTVVVTFASYLMWFWLVRHYPATQVSAFTLLAPLFGLAAGVLLLQEPLTPRLVVAAVAVSVGLLLVNRPRRPAARP
ncbi:MAG: DMT family transporter [Rubrivivax sp.]|jgi:drug/metabolite transporter (DMT)-like permease